MSNKVDRRTFINAAGAAAVTGLISKSVMASEEVKSEDKTAGIGQSRSPHRGKTAAVSVQTVQEAVCDLGHVDVLVCGGGPSGLAAAVQAARAGVKVLLIERYGRLGGMAALAMVNPLMGRVKSPLVTEIIWCLGGRRVDFERIDLLYADLLREAGADLLLHSWICGVMVKDDRVSGVYLLGKDGLMQIRAAVTIDATGDGDVAALAGAEFEQGRPGDGLVQPMSIMYRISGVARTAFSCGSEEKAREIKIGSKTWAQIVADGQKAGELPDTISVIRTYPCPRETDRGVNATQVNGVDGTKVRDLTRAELEGRRQAFRVLDFLRKHAPGYEDAYISSMPAVVGIRETRRVLGVEYLDRQHLITGRRWEDAVVRQADFVIDIHNPAGGGQAEGFAAHVKPYDIPYGCLVPRKIDNLLTAGRCISGSHDAHASYRVQCIAMAIGSAAGGAAALASVGKCLPRRIAPADIRRVIGLEK